MRLPIDLPEGLSPTERLREVTRRVLSVTPEELAAREEAYQEERRAKGLKKPGPKRKESGPEEEDPQGR